MELFVGDLPRKVSATEIAVALKHYAPRVEINVMEKIHRQLKKPIHFALIDVESDKLGKKIIQWLGNQTLSGQPLIAREFIHRSYANERRAINWRQIQWSGRERRDSERRCRRPSAEIDGEVISHRDRQVSESDGFISKIFKLNS
jgi:hypothetical protein